MIQIDLKKTQYRAFYDATREIARVDVPALKYLMVDGSGGPESPDYAEAVQALFAVSYTPEKWRTILRQPLRPTDR